MTPLLVVMTLALLVAACNDSSSLSIPTAPTGAAAPPPTTSQSPQVLRGYVVDTAFRAIAGASIEVLQGPDAGTVMTSDAQGAFSYTGMFATPVTLRASKDGYTAGTTAVRLLPNGSVYASFQLTSVVAPIAVAGNYTLTISADPACDRLPDDVRTRTYAASVVINGSSTAPPNTSFNGTATGALFAPFANVFWVGVSGNDVAVSTVGEGPSLAEQVSPNRYVAFMATARVSVSGTELSTLTGPFGGVIEYCEVPAPMATYYDCRPEVAVVREQCTSSRNTLTLTRR